MTDRHPSLPGASPTGYPRGESPVNEQGAMRAARMMVAILAAMWVLAPGPCRAATLDQSLVFLGANHARLLFLFDGEVGEVRTQSTPPLGDTPARGRIRITGAELSASLAAAYEPHPAGTQMTLAQRGIHNIGFTRLGNALQVVVEMDHARTVVVQELGNRALLLDLRVPGTPPDATLPDPDLLAQWMNGLSFTPRTEGPRPHARPRIVVDPGHGGWDHGALGCTGTHESDVVLSLARKVADGLRRALDAEIILTREDDTFITLRDRAALANARDADLFLSIHANAAPSSSLYGIETYYLDAASDEGAARVAARENAASRGNDSEVTSRVVTDLVVSGTNMLSRKLADEVQRATVSRLTMLFGEDQIRDLGVKSAMFYVLVSTRMPSILFEASFLSNPEEEMRLRTPAFQQETADAIVEGVRRYLEAIGLQDE